MDETGLAGMAKVSATPAALALLAEIVAEHGPVMLHQSGGCCDGSSPMCYAEGEFLLGDRDLPSGEVGGAPFCIGAAQGALWAHTRLTLDMVLGMGGCFRSTTGAGGGSRSARICASRRACRVGGSPTLRNGAA